MNFYEYEGMILRGQSMTENGMKNLQQWKQKQIPFVPWQYERWANHIHARMSLPDREHIRQELEIAADLEAALRAAYPDRTFVISHIPTYAVSFHQAEEGAPEAGADPLEPVTSVWSKAVPGEIWCQTCEGNRPNNPLPIPDPEFPQAEWGVCTNCRNDVLVRAGEIRTLISAS